MVARDGSRPRNESLPVSADLSPREEISEDMRSNKSEVEFAALSLKQILLCYSYFYKLLAVSPGFF